MAPHEEKRGTDLLSHNLGYEIYHIHAVTPTPKICVFTYQKANHFLFKVDRPIGNSLNLIDIKNM